MTREALARIAHGESKSQVAETTGIPYSTLTRLSKDRRDLYLTGMATDDRIAAAVAELQPLEDLTPQKAGALDARIRSIVREELHKAEVSEVR
jgi:hypothetical protein